MKRSEAPLAGLYPRPDGWSLAPEGAAVHVGAAVAVIADVHLGYEWARGRGGDCLPAHSLAETLAQVARLLDRAPIKRLIVAGDLVESPAPCVRTMADVGRLREWLAGRAVELVGLTGNHDAPGPLDQIEVVGWTIAHGHHPLAAARTITGHHHPALRASGVTTPCFLVGPTTIVLPAFSANAAGWNVLAGGWPGGWAQRTLRCVACAGAEWLDFGPIEALAGRLRGA